MTDLDAGTTRRLTDDDDDSNDPQWSPDGETIAYSVSAPRREGLCRCGRSTARRRRAYSPARDGTQFPATGCAMAARCSSPRKRAATSTTSSCSRWTDRAARQYAATSADETAARISPDGRWVAYTSDESGRSEVYLDSYPRPGRRVAVSSDGGVHPVWRGDGQELYYWHDGRLVAVRVDAKPGERASAGCVDSLVPCAVSHRPQYDVRRVARRTAVRDRPVARGPMSQGAA